MHVRGPRLAGHKLGRDERQTNEEAEKWDIIALNDEKGGNGKSYPPVENMMERKRARERETDRMRE